VSNRKSMKEEIPLKHNQAIKPSGTAGPAMSALSRRKFLGRVGVSTAVAATAAGIPSLLANKALANPEPGSNVAGIGDELDTFGVVNGRHRRERSFRVRLRAALAERRAHIPAQINNGDEALYSTRIGNYSKGLPHNQIGEVDPAALGEAGTILERGP